MIKNKTKYSEKFPGLVDVQLISEDNWDSLYDGEHNFAIPISVWKPLDKYQNTLIKSLLLNKVQKANDTISDLIEKLNNLVKENDFKEYTNAEDLKEAFKQIKSTQEELGELLEEEIDDEDLEDEAHVASMKANKVIRRLAAQMRVYGK